MKRSTYLILGLISYVLASLTSGLILTIWPESARFTHGIIGILTGLFIAAGATLINHQRAKNDPAYQRQVHIDANDERLISIRHASGNTAWLTAVILLCIYSFYLSLNGQKPESLCTAIIALISIAVYCVTLLQLNKSR